VGRLPVELCTAHVHVGAHVWANCPLNPEKCVCALGRLPGERSLATLWNGDAVIGNTEQDPSFAQVGTALAANSVVPVFLVSNALGFTGVDLNAR
jgi:hypothetical protein